MTAKPTRGSALERQPPASKSAPRHRTSASADGPPLTVADRAGKRRVAIVKDLRWKLSISQEGFAKACGIPLETLRAWERGEYEPSPTELAYIKLIERDPEHARLIVAPTPERDA